MPPCSSASPAELSRSCHFVATSPSRSQAANYHPWYFLTCCFSSPTSRRLCFSGVSLRASLAPSSSPPPFAHPNFADFRTEARKAVAPRRNSDGARARCEPFCFSTRCRKEQGLQVFSPARPQGCPPKARSTPRCCVLSSPPEPPPPVPGGDTVSPNAGVPAVLPTDGSHRQLSQARRNALSFKAQV